MLGFENMWGTYLSGMGLPAGQGTSPYAVDTTVAAVDIVAAGGAYAIILERFARTAIDAGQTIAIVGDAVPIEQSHYLINVPASQSHGTARQLFETWLEAEFAKP